MCFPTMRNIITPSSYRNDPPAPDQAKFHFAQLTYHSCRAILEAFHTKRLRDASVRPIRQHDAQFPA